MKSVVNYRYFREKPEFFIEVIKRQTAEAKNVCDLIQSHKFFPFENEGQLRNWLNGVLPLVEKLKNEDKDLYERGCYMIGRVLRWGIFEQVEYYEFQVIKNYSEYVVKTIEELVRDLRIDREKFERGIFIPTSISDAQIIKLQKMILAYRDRYPLFSAILSNMVEEQEYMRREFMLKS